MAGTAPGQDLNLSLDRIKASHGFINKLWNAGKFVLMACQGLSEADTSHLAAVDLSSAEAQAELPMAERWALGVLHQASSYMLDSTRHKSQGLRTCPMSTLPTWLLWTCRAQNYRLSCPWLSAGHLASCMRPAFVVKRPTSKSLEHQ